MLLGSAYMGAAGLSTIDLVRIMGETTADNTPSSAPSRSVAANTDSSSYAEFAKVLQRLADVNPKMLEYLSSATEIFATVTTKDESKSVGFAIGLANTAKATTTLTYLGDIEAMVNGGTTEDLTASSCIISYMYTGIVSSKCSSRTKADNNDDSDYDFNTITIEGVAYKTVTLSMSGDNASSSTYERLVSGTRGDGEMLINDRFVNIANLSKKVTLDDGSTYPNPVLIDNKPLTVQTALVDALNEGFNTIVDFGPDDTKGDIQEYKREIDLDGNGIIMPSEISAYLDKEIEK